MTKKEKVLYMQYGKRWDIIIKYKINIYDAFINADRENLLDCHELLSMHNAVCLKRLTKRFKIFDSYIYFNKLYGGDNY